MKYLKQFLWILFFSFLGEVLHAVVPLPVPASIYGLALLFFALLSGRFRLEKVRDAADYLIEIMALLFIPAGVGVMTSWEQLFPVLLPVVFIMLFSTIIVMGVSGRVTQAVIRHGRNRKTEIDANQDTKQYPA